MVKEARVVSAVRVEAGDGGVWWVSRTVEVVSSRSRRDWRREVSGGVDVRGRVEVEERWRRCWSAGMLAGIVVVRARCGVGGGRRDALRCRG